MADWCGNNFPIKTSNPLGKRRHLLVDYGSVGNVEVLPTESGSEVNFVSQKQHGWNNGSTQLCATAPTLPLLPPNPVDDPTFDPCMGELKARRKRILHTQWFLLWKKGLAKYDPVKKEKYRRWLGNLQSCRDGSKVETDFALRNTHDTLRSLKEFTKSASDLFKQPPFVPIVNSAYTGGGVSFQARRNGDGLLLHPRGPGMDLLTCSVVQLGDKPEVLATKEVDQMEGCIQEIDSSTVAGSYFCGVRTSKKQCTLYQFDDMGEDVTWQRMYSRTWDVCTPTAISLSSFIPGECLVTTDNGDVYLWSAQNSLEKVVSGLESRFLCYEDWWSAHYAGHPRLLTVADRTGVSIYDIRCKPSTGEDLYVLPQKALHPQERVLACIPHPSNSLYHVASLGVTVALLDQRMPKTPVLTLHHSLDHPAIYMDIAPKIALDEAFHDILLLGYQQHPDVCAFQFKLAQANVPPVSTSRPWKLSRASDILVGGVLDEFKVPHSVMTDRLDATLCGVSAATHPDNDGFTAFQLTVHGDLFYQTYKPSAEKRDKTLSSGPGSNKLLAYRDSYDILPRWVQTTKEMAKAAWKEVEHKEVDKITDATNSFNMILPTHFGHILCRFCISAPVRPEYEEEPDIVCCNCGYFTDVSAKLKKVVEKGETVVIEKPGDEPPKLADHIESLDPLQYKDTFSKLLLHLWDEEDITDLVQEMDEERKEKRRLRAENKKKQQEDVRSEKAHSDESVSCDDDDENRDLRDEQKKKKKNTSKVLVPLSDSEEGNSDEDAAQCLPQDIANSQSLQLLEALGLPHDNSLDNIASFETKGLVHSTPYNLLPATNSQTAEQKQTHRQQHGSSFIGEDLVQSMSFSEATAFTGRVRQPSQTGGLRRDRSANSIASSASSVRSSGSGAGFLATPRRMHLYSSRSSLSDLEIESPFKSPFIKLPKFTLESTSKSGKPSTVSGTICRPSPQHQSLSHTLGSGKKRKRKKQSVMGF